ncbi:hypothetical protein CCR94_10780 [Rhodoblastus sphagnicola]|uniref:Uncharacterized protein n=1 Tax=Rhodoblastus sphagnicola TaxID=333368 RepID=A0A2S6N8P0_9HYPH|nr:hypothetical protein [Rhodoblastus sphagnicola]MBB4199935.1 hypothetical protein [Rhodoblastus sphagnicola]PPQ30957.1 hypothetical protein CCR94_10780 [Rhodoblastus sphagnicola]
MTQRTPPSLMEGIKQGIEAAGQALLEDSRRTGRPLATLREGKVVLVDADGRIMSEPPKTTNAAH